MFITFRVLRYAAERKKHGRESSSMLRHRRSSEDGSGVCVGGGWRSRQAAEKGVRYVSQRADADARLAEAAEGDRHCDGVDRHLLASRVEYSGRTVHTAAAGQ